MRCPDIEFHKEGPHVHAACDGLFIVSFGENTRLFYICNPTTRQLAPLPPLHEHQLPNRRIQIAALYKHQPCGEYRVLYSIWTKNEDEPTSNVDLYVLVVGSNDPRQIGQLPVSLELLKGLRCCWNAPALHHGNLHWDLMGRYFGDATKNILVFDIVFETFRWIQPPADKYIWKSLLEMNNVLAMWCSRNWINIDIYVMQDYTREVWTLTHQINIFELGGSPSLHYTKSRVLKIVMLNERELLIELSNRIILHCDIDGKFLGTIECDGVEDNCMDITPYHFRENIVPLPFFDMQDDSDNNVMLGGDNDMHNMAIEYIPTFY
jgi:F-box interacting protein